MLALELHCRRCGWRTVCGRDDAVVRLRRIGLLRRDPEADDEVVAELLVEAAPRIVCPGCEGQGLVVRSADEGAELDEGDWQAAVLCDVCREPIAAERLEALPGVKRCAACQGLAESGRLPAPIEYCPQCGAAVEIRTSRGAGITRYKRFCTGSPACRL